ncbi:MAG: DnaJ domain-containing protein [Chlorobi bacterium]|nr:DnaJ domain-containing protein [Chlorobiota bacterium]
MLPYEAYRIMGVLPSVTKLQLKKTYRTLAKKYHPDKFAGQSEEIIQKAEEKILKIKEASYVILKHKTYILFPFNFILFTYLNPRIIFRCNF